MALTTRSISKISTDSASMWQAKMIQHLHHHPLRMKKKQSQLLSNSPRWSNQQNRQEVAVEVAGEAPGEAVDADVARILLLASRPVDMTMGAWRILEETTREILDFAVRAMAGSQSGVVAPAGEAVATAEAAGEEASSRCLKRASGAATEAGAVDISNNRS
jgi:mannosyltransferase OCH1-like enzyme